MSTIDTRMVSLIAGTLPTLSDEICDGLPEAHMRAAEDYIHQIIKCAIDGILPGLKYIGPVRCTPYEEFAEITRPSKPKRSFDLSRSDLYMIKYMFSFNGEVMRPRYVQLPYISDGALIRLNGTQYAVTPVLGGTVFNIERGTIHLRIPRAMMKFSKIPATFRLNGKVHNTDVVYSPLYNMSAAERPAKLVTLLTHYILAEYGLTEMMRKFYGVDVKIGGKELDTLVATGEWYVASSVQLPITRAQGHDTVFSEIRIAVPSGQYTQILDSVIASIMYIADVRPEAMVIADLDNPRLWISILPTFLFRKDSLDQKRFDEMTNHLSWLKEYMDQLTIRLLAKDNVIVKDIFELFSYITTHMNDMIAHHDVGTMFNQELSTVKHMCYNITHNIFSLMYRLRRIPLERLSADKITTEMNDILRVNRIQAITKHGEVNATSVASDCKPFSYTARMISQYKAANTDEGAGHQSIESDPAKLLHPSQAEVSNLLLMTKSDPSSRSSLNPFVHMRNGSLITPRPDNIKAIKSLTTLLKGDVFKHK